MNAQHFKRFGAFAALVATCFAGSALAQSEGEEPPTRRDEETRSGTDAVPTVVAPALDRNLLKRVQDMEGARRTARKEGLKDPKAWEAGRAQRASAHRQQLATLWGSITGTLDGQARLRMHAERMARLNRLLDLAEQKNDEALIATITADIGIELRRHVQAMQMAKAVAGLQ